MCSAQAASGGRCGLAATQHPARLSQPVAVGWHAGSHPPRASESKRAPTAAIIDSQSVKSAEKGGRGLDPTWLRLGKIKGKKRHVLVDTQGLMLRHGRGRHPVGMARCGAACIRSSPSSTPMPDTKVPALPSGEALGQLNVEIVAHRFDQSDGWSSAPSVNRCRRLAKDWENQSRNALAFLSLPSASCSENYAITFRTEHYSRANRLGSSALGLDGRCAGPAVVEPGLIRTDRSLAPVITSPCDAIPAPCAVLRRGPPRPNGCAMTGIGRCRGKRRAAARMRQQDGR